MRARELLREYAELWRGATHHPFLDGVREGTLDEGAFARWLAQDYHFGVALTRAQGRTLASAPREDLETLADGIRSMVAELAWFEEKARERRIALDVPIHPTARAYVDFLHALSYAPYGAQITALWALELAYLEAWRSARPGAPRFREFVERWTQDGFAAHVAALEAATDRVLARAGEAEREAFCWVARYERAFWEMAHAGPGF